MAVFLQFLGIINSFIKKYSLPLFYALVVLVVLGSMGKLSCHKDIVTGQTTRVDSIIVHDTVIHHDTIAKVTQKIVPGKPQIVYKYDTVSKDSVAFIDSTKKDTLNCYSFDSHEKDGAYIKAEMCSREFPIKKPSDFQQSLIYKAPPDTQRTFYRTDTLKTKIPFYNDWKLWGVITAVVAAISFIGGANR